MTKTGGERTVVGKTFRVKNRRGKYQFGKNIVGKRPGGEKLYEKRHAEQRARGSTGHRKATSMQSMPKQTVMYLFSINCFFFFQNNLFLCKFR